MLSIQTNQAAMQARTNLDRTQRVAERTMVRLSSGTRINGAADDAAGLGITRAMEARLRSFGAATRNTMDGISMAQVADGAADQIHGILSRMRELAVQGSNGTLGASDSTNLDTEFQASLGEIDRIAAVTSFNGKNLLAGAAAAVTFQVGIDNVAGSDRISVSFGGADVTRLSLTGAAVDSAANARTAIGTIDSAIQSLSTVRSGFGSAINRFSATLEFLSTAQTTATAASISRMKDADIAEETSLLARTQVLNQSAAAVLSQANQSPQLALALLRG